jgi:hypothetical protein
MAIVSLTPGVDHVSGRDDENNLFLATPSTLGFSDTITGTQSSTFYDVLALTAGGTLTPAQFSGVTGIEILALSGAGNSVVLSNQLVAGTNRDIFAVIGAAGDDTVDASLVTNGQRIAFYAGSGESGRDSFIGGNGNDYFEFASDQLTGVDTVVGGDGFDVLAFRTGGLISAAALTNVFGIEEIFMSDAGNSITLNDAMVADAINGVMAVLAGLTSNDTVDASGITNGVRIAFYARDGATTFTGGNGSDYLSFMSDKLTAADHVDGGANFDIIEIATPGAVSASAFANVKGIDELILNHGGSDVTLSDGVVAGSDNGVFVVFDGNGSDTVNAASVIADRVVFAASMGNDGFTGGGGSDVALWSPYDLNDADTFAGGAGFDILQLTTAGTVAASAFANFTGVDELFLTASATVVTLGGAMVASSDNQVFVVYDEAANDTVDGSGATLGGRIVFEAVGGHHHAYTGGTGSDFFIFADANLDATDTLAGGNGAGTDFLQVTTAASVTAADLANVTQIEVVQLAAGGSIALANTLSNSGSLDVDGSGAVDVIDGSAVSSYNLVIKGGGGADALKGGTGNDQIFLPDTNFVAIDGNGGFDKILLTAAFDGQTFDLTSQAPKVAHVEAITLDGAAGATVALGPDDIAQINPSGDFLYVAGGSDDQIDVKGSGWTILETNHTNANLAGHTFIHAHNANGSDLYFDSTFPIIIASSSDFFVT